MRVILCIALVVSGGCGRTPAGLQPIWLPMSMAVCAPGGVADRCGSGFDDVGPIWRVGTIFLSAGFSDDDKDAYGLTDFAPARALTYTDACHAEKLDEFLGSHLGNGQEIAISNLRTRLWTTPDGTWVFQPPLRLIAWIAPKGSRVDPVPQGQARHGTSSDPTPASTDDAGFIVVAGTEHIERLTHSVNEAARVWRAIGTFLISGCGSPKSGPQ